MRLKLFSKAFKFFVNLLKGKANLKLEYVSFPMFSLVHGESLLT